MENGIVFRVMWSGPNQGGGRMRVKKAIIDLTLRVVVSCDFSDLHDDAIDAILTRALQADIPPELQTIGFVAADHIETEVIHGWEEEK